MPEKDRRKAIFAALLLATLALLISGAAAGARQPLPGGSAQTTSGMMVLRVYYDSIADIDRLRRFDVLEVNNLEEQYVLVLGDSAVYNQLLAAGWRVSLDEQGSRALLGSPGANTFSEGYRTVEEIYSWLHEINALYPELTEVVDYGASYCQGAGGCVTPGGDMLAGYELKALRITNELIAGGSSVDAGKISRGSKPIFFLLAGIHAREITTPEVAMRMAEWLLNGYSQIPDATWLVDWHEVWIVPVANPDGHWLVELGTAPEYGSSQPFYQRKNADRDSDGDGSDDCGNWVWPPSGVSQYGVDLNRNHSYGWGGEGSSGLGCDQTFRGAAAASEPEVADLQALVLQLIPDQRGEGSEAAAGPDTTGIFISLHSYSQLVLWPWGTTGVAAPNQAGLRAIGDRLAAFNSYQSCQAARCLYAASGTSDDWVYGTLGIPAFTFEIGRQFFPPYSEIDGEQWPLNGPALQYAAAIARQPYRQIDGPEIADLAVSHVGSAVKVQATATGWRTGVDTVSGAALTLEKPYWSAGAEEQEMAAVDGVFDSQLEFLEATIDISSLDAGRHIILVTGRDEAGNRGAASAIFLDVTESRALAYLPLIGRWPPSSQN